MACEANQWPHLVWQALQAGFDTSAGQFAVSWYGIGSIAPRLLSAEKLQQPFEVSYAAL